MGVHCEYHVTMLVTSEQEDAIRVMFKNKSWPCWLKVLSDANVTDIIQSGFTDVFPILAESHDGGIRCSVFTEIKTEVDNTGTEHGNASDETIEQNVSDGEDAESDMNLLCSNIQSEDASVTTEAEDTAVTNKRKRSRPQQIRPAKSSSHGNGAIPQNRCRVKCTVCDVYYSNKYILKRHCLREHPDDWFEFKCKDCSSMFKTTEALFEHRNEVKHEPPKNKPKMAEKKNHSPEELAQMGHLKCNACGKYFPSRRLLRRHFYYAHREIMPDPTCAVCETQFKTRQELWKHKRETKHNDSLWTLGHYQCDSCGKILHRYDAFKTHKKNCGREKTEEEERRTLPCDICGALFKSIALVKAHTRGVHLVAPVVCDVCGTVCKNKRSLFEHKKRHDDKNKKFACDECGRSFFNSTILKQHIRTHTKEKPFKCPMCKYTCAVKQNIHKHSIKAHKIQLPAVDLRECKEGNISLSSNPSDSGQNVESQSSNSGKNVESLSSNPSDSEQNVDVESVLAAGQEFQIQHTENTLVNLISDRNGESTVASSSNNYTHFINYEAVDQVSYSHINPAMYQWSNPANR